MHEKNNVVSFLGRDAAENSLWVKFNRGGCQVDAVDIMGISLNVPLE